MPRRSRSAILLALALACLPAARLDAGALAVERAADGRSVEVRVTPSRTAEALLELLDAASGRCVRTLYAGRSGREQVVTLNRGEGPPAGAYRLRYREGL